jgi:hypothetical protein
MTANTDLITGLCEDVVLGEVVSRLCRWNKRPLLSILNRTWMKVMTERFPIYDVAFQNIPNIQSNALILSHIKKPRARRLPINWPVFGCAGPITTMPTFVRVPSQYGFPNIHYLRYRNTQNLYATIMVYFRSHHQL